MLEVAFALEIAAAPRRAAIATAAGVPQTVSDMIDGALCNLYASCGAIGYSSEQIAAIVDRHVVFDSDGQPAPRVVNDVNVVTLTSHRRGL